MIGIRLYLENVNSICVLLICAASCHIVLGHFLFFILLSLRLEIFSTLLATLLISLFFLNLFLFVLLLEEGVHDGSQDKIDCDKGAQNDHHHKEKRAGHIRDCILVIVHQD